MRDFSRKRRGCHESDAVRYTPETRDVMSLVDSSPGPGACWPWKGPRAATGYGRFRDAGKTQWAHRVVLAKKIGRQLERGEVTRHSCDNPSCCNPDHLTVGTQSENMADRVARGRTRNRYTGRLALEDTLRAFADPIAVTR